MPNSPKGVKKDVEGGNFYKKLQIFNGAATFDIKYLTVPQIN